MGRQIYDIHENVLYRYPQIYHHAPPFFLKDAAKLISHKLEKIEMKLSICETSRTCQRRWLSTLFHKLTKNVK
jgi:hypothetical protein